MLYIPLPIGRVCRNCDIWKPYAILKKHKHQPDGIEKMCLDCNRRQAGQYYADHTDEVLQRLRDEYAVNPERIKTRNKRSREKPENKIKAIARAKEWAINNPEKVKQAKRKWQEAHAEEYKVIRRRCYQNKREHYLRKNKEYAKAHPEQRKKTQQKSNAKRREQLKTYRREHTLRYRMHAEVRRSRMRALPATFTVDDWHRCVDYWRECCAICNRPQGLWHKLAQDHWIPVSRGGAYTSNNIIPLCHGINGCNNSKNDSDPIVWLTSRFGKRKAALILKRITAYFTWIAEQSK